MSENLKLSIDNGTKRIKVNDQGEYIMLPCGDQEFISSFLGLMNEFGEKSGQLAQSIREEDLSKAAALNLQTCDAFKQRVNEVFRDDRCCQKVFGDITPSVTAFMEFFGQLMPFIESYNNERTASIERISKYTAKYNRKEVS